MGRTVVEAMAAGLPLVASRVGGIVDLVDDGKTGILVEPGDATALAAAIAALLDRPAAARDLGLRAARSVGPELGEEAMADRLLELYRAELDRCR